ncbi:hypothetical protein RvY_07059 [Ramazzottius varieornatus]|uniref:Protein FAM50 homolog n=1 Tax=Ramazzottius varieornatus TaxID=947166 RepID=A0A1D1V9D3_RAMVA|nr:hypothetical protein RvY_07059 [Ramazzottius varieornatus]
MTEYRGGHLEVGRAMQLMKKREKEKEEVEHRKRKMAEDTKIANIDNKFAAHYDAIEQQLKTSTVGLVTLDEMKAKQTDVIAQRERELAQKQEAEHNAKQAEAKKVEELRRSQRDSSKLSFAVDDGEDEEEEAQSEASGESYERKRRRIGMDPSVDTSFLPDKDKEDEEKRLREQLRVEWVAKQEVLKQELMEVIYSYWDGAGHRRTQSIRKGSTVQQFLQKCLDSLRSEFNELRVATVDQLMYVKEDMIIPQHYSFYDLIVTKARGKTGPLFEFDVHEDVRLLHDATREKNESHAGKVVQRTWYERNKHIFPASRWEPYDAGKKYGDFAKNKTDGM